MFPLSLNLAGVLLFAIIAREGPRDQPLPPAWSPDHGVLATTTVPENFVTPEGGNYSVLLNGRTVYPIKTHHWFADFYANWHTILSDFEWSPDSQHVAFVEKIYDWAYSDPYDRYLDGRVSNEHFYLAIVSREGKATGYRLENAPTEIELRWDGAHRLLLNQQNFDIQATPPTLIP